jgi:PAS domain S-box-containing protein
MSTNGERGRDQLLRETERVRAALAESLTLTERILDAVPGGVVHVGVDGSIKAANAEALRILGMRFDQITQRYTHDWDPDTIFEDGSPCSAADYPVTKALATGEPQRALTLGVRRPDGTLSWAVFTAVALVDAAGNVTGAVATFLDITERKRIEDALRESEAKLKAVVSSVPDIIITTDRDGIIQFVNRTIETVTPEQVIGTRYLDYVGPEDQERVRGYLRRVLDHGESVSWELRGVAPADPNWWSARAGPVERGGAVVGMTAVATNITERVQAQAERERLQAQLAAAQRLEAVGRLAGGVAHDFNNLLTVIQGNADLLRRRLGDTSHGALLEQIRAASEKAAVLTRQLLAFGRQQPLEVQTVDVNGVIVGVEAMLRRLVREDVHLELDLADGPVAIRADPVQLERVLLNLATNARDAMPEGGRLRIVTRALERDTEAGGPGRRAVLEVTDSGRGIDEETQRHIFEPFFTTKRHGVGLGLASVHGIVTQSGGTICVESSAGAGTTFRIFFPRVEELPPRAAAPRAAALDEGAKAATILLVEDNDDVRSITTRMLEAAGYHVLVAGSASEATRACAAAERPIDLLVSDVVMPEISGPKLAERLLQKEPRLRVLFVSGYADEEIRVRGLSPDDVGFLAKPYTAEALTRRVRRILGS